MEEQKLNRREEMQEWAEIMTTHTLPAWDELPDLELYMDQVVSLVSNYLSHLGRMLGEEKPITPAMINNYVKMGLMRAPVKKRYTRAHLASLIMICILKRSLNMSAIQKLIPGDMSDDEIRERYEAFRVSRSDGINFLAGLVRSGDKSLFPENDSTDGREVVIRLAVMANLLKLGAEKLVGATEEDQKPKKEKKAKSKA